MLHVKPVHGEPTCYEVESHHMQCTGPECRKLTARAPDPVWFNRRQQDFLAGVGLWTRAERALAKLREGWKSDGQCRRCGAALEPRWHRVDVAALDLNGFCTCEYFECALGKAARQATKPERQAGKFRCSHIEAARDFALDLSLAAHERANGRKK